MRNLARPYGRRFADDSHWNHRVSHARLPSQQRTGFNFMSISADLRTSYGKRSWKKTAASISLLAVMVSGLTSVALGETYVF